MEVKADVGDDDVSMLSPPPFVCCGCGCGSCCWSKSKMPPPSPLCLLVEEEAEEAVVEDDLAETGVQLLPVGDGWWLWPSLEVRLLPPLGVGECSTALDECWLALEGGRGCC